MAKEKIKTEGFFLIKNSKVYKDEKILAWRKDHGERHKSYLPFENDSYTAVGCARANEAQRGASLKEAIEDYEKEVFENSIATKRLETIYINKTYIRSIRL